MEQTNEKICILCQEIIHNENEADIVKMYNLLFHKECFVNARMEDLKQIEKHGKLINEEKL